MKKVFAVVMIGAAAVGLMAVSSSGDAVAASSEPQVDLEQVNARIDARLHDVLGQLIAQRAGR